MGSGALFRDDLFNFGQQKQTTTPTASQDALSQALAKQADANTLKLQADTNQKNALADKSNQVFDSFSKGLAESGSIAPMITAAKANLTKLGPVATSDAANINKAPQEQFRNQEMSLASALQAQAAGQGPSLAQSQLQQGTDRNIAQALAMQASMRGQTAGQGLRNIAQQTSQLNSQAARDSAALRMQEQMNAQQQLAGVLGQGRSADIGLATSQAGLTQQAGLANMDAKNQANLQQGQLNQGVQLANVQSQNQTNAANLQSVLNNNQMNNDMKKFYLTSQMGMTDAEANRALGYAGQAIQQDLGTKQNNLGYYQANTGIIGSVLGGLGAVGAAAVSDKRAKKNIKDGDKPLKEFLDALNAHSYEYKDKADGEGSYVSPMAQEIEGTKLGKDMVINTQDGKKMVDYGRAGGAMLASAAMLNKRMDALEKALKASKRKG